MTPNLSVLIFTQELPKFHLTNPRGEDISSAQKHIFTEQICVFISTLACKIARIGVFEEVSAIPDQQGMVGSHGVWCIPQLLHEKLWGSVTGVCTFKSILYTVKAEIILGCEAPLKAETGCFVATYFSKWGISPSSESGNSLRILKYIKRSTDFINITVKVVGDFPENVLINKGRCETRLPGDN